MTRSSSLGPLIIWFPKGGTQEQEGERSEEEGKGEEPQPLFRNPFRKKPTQNSRISQVELQMGGETKTVTTIKLFKRIKEAQVGIYRYDDPDKMDHASWPLATVTIEKGGWENKKRIMPIFLMGEKNLQWGQNQLELLQQLGEQDRGSLETSVSKILLHGCEEETLWDRSEWTVDDYSI